MTVKQLIELLKKYPEKARVLIPGYEGGFDDVVYIKTHEFAINYAQGEPYVGNHEILGEFNCSEEQSKYYAIENCVYLTQYEY